MINSIDQPYLISKLIDRPVTDREFGFNDAIIVLLKSTKPKPESESDKLRQCLSAYYSVLTNEQRREIIEFKRTHDKLFAVKSLKDATGMGLKEAKEYIDKFWVM